VGVGGLIESSSIACFDPLQRWQVAAADTAQCLLVTIRVLPFRRCRRREGSNRISSFIGEDWLARAFG
jgi:hypothetical protein